MTGSCCDTPGIAGGIGARGQLSLSMNSAASLSAIPYKERGAVPTFASVKDTGALLVVTGAPPSPRDAVDRLTKGNVAVPLMGTF